MVKNSKTVSVLLILFHSDLLIKFSKGLILNTFKRWNLIKLSEELKEK